MHGTGLALAQLGAIFFALGVLGRLARRIGISPIPLYLLGGLAFGQGVWSRSRASRSSPRSPRRSASCCSCCCSAWSTRRASSSPGCAVRGRPGSSTREFSIVIAGLAVTSGAVDPALAPLATAYVLLMAILGPVAARAVEPVMRWTAPGGRTRRGPATGTTVTSGTPSGTP